MWDYNYLGASLDLYGDFRLLTNPDQVAKSEQVAWQTALWYWSKRVHILNSVKTGSFGSSTSAINGAWECFGNGNATRAMERFAVYVKVMKAFNLNETPIESGCYN
jgi:predicted chitinase